MNARFERGNLTFAQVDDAEATRAAFLADLVRPGGLAVQAAQESIEVEVAADVDTYVLQNLMQKAGVEYQG